MGASPPVTVTEAPAEFDQPVATPATLPNTGGPVVVSGNTTDPDGTTFHLLVNGTDSGLITTSSGGAYSFPAYTVAPNPALTPATVTFDVST
jgi:hypothetical protein